jgi:hypothetical protein
MHRVECLASNAWAAHRLSARRPGAGHAGPGLTGKSCSLPPRLVRDRHRTLRAAFDEDVHEVPFGRGDSYIVAKHREVMAHRPAANIRHAHANGDAAGEAERAVVAARHLGDYAMRRAAGQADHAFA